MANVISDDRLVHIEAPILSLRDQNGAEYARYANGVGSGLFNVAGFVAPPGSGDTTGATDTATLQALINSAAAAGSSLYLPAGGYTVTNLTAPAAGGSVKIYGAGPNRTTIGAAAGATGIVLDLTYSSTSPVNVEVQDLSIHCTNSVTMTALRTQKISRLLLRNLNFRYGAIGWEHVQTAGAGPINATQLNFQNHTTEAIHITGSSGLGNAGKIRDCFIQVTDNTVTLTRGILIDWFTTGMEFDNVQILGNIASTLLIHSGIVYSTAAPTGNQGAFLWFTNCVTDQIDTGHGLDLTNARGIQSVNNFWSVQPASSGGTGQGGVNINGGYDHMYANDWISGQGIVFSNTPDRVSVGSGCRFPQTQTGGALVMPASNPPTNLILAQDIFPEVTITNDVPKLETATKNAWGWTRAGGYT